MSHDIALKARLCNTCSQRKNSCIFTGTPRASRLRGASRPYVVLQPPVSSPACQCNKRQRPPVRTSERTVARPWRPTGRMLDQAAWERPAAESQLNKSHQGSLGVISAIIRPSIRAGTAARGQTEERKNDALRVFVPPRLSTPRCVPSVSMRTRVCPLSTQYEGNRGR